MQIVNLDSFDLLAVEGADAKKFLQGQVSCNMNLLTESRSLRGAICNLKGRVISDFRVVEIGGICYLKLASGLGAIVKPVLDKYIVFSKAGCFDRTGLYRCSGLIGAGIEDLLLDHNDSLPEAADEVLIIDQCRLVRIDSQEPRYELWYPAAADTLPEPFDSLVRRNEDSTITWQLADYRAGIVHITPGLNEQHLPEALNYDRSGVIDFKKGCYTGQEIVARMYYRGTPKKRTCYLLLEGRETVPERIECHAEAPPHQAETGELLGYLHDGDGNTHMLAILPASLALQGGEVFINGDETLTARLQSLPYALQ